MSYIGGGKDFIKQMHDLSPNCDLCNFYKSQEQHGKMKRELMELAQTLISIAPTSAGLERTFSNMGFVHSELKNRLLPEKVAFCVRCLNDD